MRARVVMHNTVSIDGAVTGFDVDMELHYRVASRYEAGAVLMGSVTAKSGVEAFGDASVPETAGDRKRPAVDPDDDHPLWVIPDSAGALEGALHHIRRYEHCKDVIVLTTERTPAAYLEYLDDREIRHYTLGEERVDLTRALEMLASEHHVETVLTDGGPSLCAALFGRGLVDEVSLIVAPVVVGAGSSSLFRDLTGSVCLDLARLEKLDRGAIGLRYIVHGEHPE